MDLRIQWSLLTRIKAAAAVYEVDTTAGQTDSLKSYLAALEKLAEYVETRQRGSAIFQEMRINEQPAAKTKWREPKVVPLTPPLAASDYEAAAGAGEMSLAG